MFKWIEISKDGLPDKEGNFWVWGPEYINPYVTKFSKLEIKALGAYFRNAKYPITHYSEIEDIPPIPLIETRPAYLDVNFRYAVIYAANGGKIRQKSWPINNYIFLTDNNFQDQDGNPCYPYPTEAMFYTWQVIEDSVLETNK